MFDLLSLSTIIPLLKIAVGVAIFGDMLLFLFKLLTGRYSFLKNKGGGGKIARAFMPDAEFAEAAFEEVRQSKKSEQGRVGTKPGAADPHAAIMVTVAADGSVKVDIPDDAFELDGAGR
jgi:hypothetical protein